MTPQNGQNEHIFDQKSQILGYFTTLRVENKTTSRPFKVKNNAQTLPKQLRKSPEYDFFDPQNVQNTDA